MLQHNLIIFLRNIQRYKTTFLINIIGLSTGLACVLLIYLWVNDERSVDTFHQWDSQLYQLMINFELPNGTQTWDYSPAVLGEALATEMPEVKMATMANGRYHRPVGILTKGDRHFYQKGLFARDNFFQVLSYDLIEGDKDQVLSDINNIIISEELALKIFNTTENIIGESLEWDNQFLKQTFQVSGVFKNPPSNASAQFDVVIHYDLLIKADENAASWNGTYAETYLVLEENTDIEAFNKKISKYLLPKANGWEPASLFVQQYSKKYLYNNYEEGKLEGGRIVSVRLFSIIALFILLIACINFMNLSTVQAARKMKEIGVKKVIGADRKLLVFQFLGESLLMVTIALLIALSIVVFFLPQFNVITGKALSLNMDISVLLSLLAILLFTALLSGSYPAFYLSGFKPIGVLNGKLNTSKPEVWIRKGLVVFQFILSVIFIVSVLVINKQMEYIQTKNLGYQREHVISFQIPQTDSDPKFFVEELKKLNGVESTANMVWTILSGNDNGAGYSWGGEESEKEILFQSPRMGYNAIETLGMELLTGRTFSRDYNDDYTKIILNEAALDLMKLDNPIGKKLGYGKEQREIIGVVKNFHYGSLHKKVEPLIIRFRALGRDIMVRTGGGMESTAINGVKRVFKTFFPQHPFEYSFLDADYQVLYKSENRVAVLSRYFTGLAIIISCMGLFGLSVFTAERRRKEISIRKVLGQSVGQVSLMLTSEFVQLVLVAVIIALPLAYGLMQYWLSNFAYHIPLSIWYFVSAGLIALVIAILTVGSQALNAANRSPVYALRGE